jgi:hypothetical protein
MVQITVIPSSRQIRYYAESTINAFDTLSTDDAIKANIGHLRQLLRYIDSLDRANNLVVAGISPVEGGIKIERTTRDGDVFDLIDRYLGPSYAKLDAT